MNPRVFVPACAALMATVSSFGANVQPTDIFTATTRIDTRDWSTEPIAIFYPGAVLTGEYELWVVGFGGDVWHIDTLTGAKTLLGNKETPGTLKNRLNVITKLGDRAIVVPFSEARGTTEFSHVVFDLETGERRTFLNPDILGNIDLIGLPNGNLLGTGGTGILTITDGQGQTLVKTEATQVRGFALHPDGRIIGIAFDDMGGSRLMEIHPETADVTAFATLPGIRPTRIAVAPDGTYYAAERHNNNDFTIFRIDGQSFAVSEIPLPPDDFRLSLEFDLDVDSNGTVLVSIENRQTRRLNEFGFPVILGIDPATMETEIVVGGFRFPDTEPAHMSMGADNAIYFVPKATGVGDENRVLRQDLKTGGITVVTNHLVEGAVIDRARMIAVDGDDIYVINDAGNPEWEQLVHVDRLTGEQTLLGSFGARLLVQQMLVDPADGSLLLAVWGGTAGTSRAILRVIPQANPVFERVNPVPLPGNPMFFDIAPNGSLVVYVTGAEGSVLYRIDRNSGAWSPIGDRVLPPNYTGALVVLNDGTIVARGFRDERTRIVLETIDPVTGAATEVMDTPPHAALLIRPHRGSGGRSRLSAATGAQSIGDGWFQSAWYGRFKELDAWDFHHEHGWQYFGSGSGDSLLYFDFGLNAWLSTHASYYPLLYAYPPRGGWLFYQADGEPGNRWFFSFSANSWVRVP